MTNPFKNRTIRGLMIVVLAIGATVAGWVYLGRREDYRRMAEHHLGEMAAMASVSRSSGHTADMYEGKAPHDAAFAFRMPIDNTNQLREAEVAYARRADYHASLSRKYRQAADRPWLALEPDPPSP